MIHTYKELKILSAYLRRWSEYTAHANVSLPGKDNVGSASLKNAADIVDAYAEIIRKEHANG